MWAQTGRCRISWCGRRGDCVGRGMTSRTRCDDGLRRRAPDSHRSPRCHWHEAREEGAMGALSPMAPLVGTLLALGAAGACAAVVLLVLVPPRPPLDTVALLASYEAQLRYAGGTPRPRWDERLRARVRRRLARADTY